MTDDLVIEVKELCKSYGKLEALKGLSFGLKRGSVLGVTGATDGRKNTFKLRPVS